MVSEQVGRSGQVFVILIIHGVRHVCEHCRYIVYSNSCLLLFKGMSGRNDTVVADSLTVLAQVVKVQQNPLVEDVESRGLDRFLRNKPPTFKGRHDPEGAQVWLQEIEKIFRVLACANALKIRYGAYILSEEAEYLWDNARQRFEANGTMITWVVFK